MQDAFLIEKSKRFKHQRTEIHRFVVQANSVVPSGQADTYHGGTSSTPQWGVNDAKGWL